MLWFRPSQTTSTASRLFSSTGSPKRRRLDGRTPIAFFPLPRSFLSLLFHLSYWLIYTVKQRSVCRYRCVSDSKTTVNCLFLFTTRPLLLVRCPSRVLRPALLPIPELCDDYSIDAIILPCVLLIPLPLFPWLIYRSKFQWITPGLYYFWVPRVSCSNVQSKRLLCRRLIASNGNRSVNLALKNDN